MNRLANSLTRRQVIKIGTMTLAASLPSFLGSSTALAATPMRRNIDALSHDELVNYKHAVAILMERSVANPGAMDGYGWQAALHNDFERIRGDGCAGACEHRSEFFFPWHRAHLAGFEFLLRAADPPRTANVAIPYWDWTTPASGVRFPIALEDTASPLFHDGRHFTGSSPIQWDADEIKTKMVQEPEWLLFAGDPLQSDGTGGACPNWVGGSFGWVEDGPHNAIHGLIGPTMGDPEKASRDPIYWSFHAYIDLIWARWQRVHTDATHPQPFTDPEIPIWVEPFNPKVGDMAQTDTLPAGYAYGYDYDFSIDAAPMIVAADAAPAQRTLEPAVTGERIVTTAPLRVKAPKRQLLRLRDVVVLPEVTYAIRAYVHPPSVNIQLATERERERYLADTATVWMSRHARHHTNVNLELTRAIAAFGGNQFAISLVTESRPLVENPAGIEAARSELDGKVAAFGPLWSAVVLEEH